VSQRVILELKSVGGVSPLRDSILLTYLKLPGLHTGLLIDFNVLMLPDGIRRFVL
jgi:GxxExxY protein